MGQAKQRGTYEERRQQAQERKAKQARIFAEKRRAEREAEEARVEAMSEEERRTYYAPKNRLSTLLALTAAAMIPMGSRKFSRRSPDTL